MGDSKKRPVSTVEDFAVVNALLGLGPELETPCTKIKCPVSTLDAIATVKALLDFRPELEHPCA